ncbi:hypothetical protein ACFLX2_00455 [Candidatus Dependentiae bacterium]
MKKFGKSRFKNAWKKLMDSTHRNISRGASSINKIISWARSDNWRRKQKSTKGGGKER